jgi:hypothetical protein
MHKIKYNECHFHVIITPSISKTVQLNLILQEESEDLISLFNMIYYTSYFTSMLNQNLWFVLPFRFLNSSFLSILWHVEPLLGNDSVYTFPWQRIRRQQSDNFRCYATHAKIELVSQEVFSIGLHTSIAKQLMCFLCCGPIRVYISRRQQ